MEKETSKFDLCVIGGGPAGFAATMRALDLGKKVALIEKNKIGGAGIYDGALSSKTLWELSKDVNRIRNRERGYLVHDSELDYRSLVQSMHEAEEERASLLRKQLAYFEHEVESPNLTTFDGFASFVSPHEISITSSNGTVRTIQSDFLILASGTRPRKIPAIPIDEKTIVTSDGVATFDKFPESLVILGAGVIGCEFATIFCNFGKTKVFLIDKADRILPFEDEDISNAIANNLESKGVTIHRNSALESMTIEDGRVKYVLNYKDGRQETHFAEKGLVSIGRVPNIEHMGLEEIGIAFNKRGGPICQDTRTTVDHIYAVGDLTGDICLVNVGEQEGRHTVEKIFNNSPKSMSYNNVSTIMFLDPEVAGIGMNERQAMEANIPYRVACYGYRYIARASAMRNTNGFFKILVTDDDEMRILGMRALGAQASSSIQAVALLISMQKGIEELAELIHPHPSIVEGIQDCVRMLKGKSIIKPYVFDKYLRCSRVVNGKCYDIT